uniref:EF-hand domain-containing protein n=1 Tax=Chromera velia CCMP2878 TaxID=1169474 RepID=A0A0G4HYH1_9ALVE|eukprot:Cvel_9497.t1-p1 / transcript=Cvel_9497.t1 / gene=Cvel_9497 / organism=Chromera_velia_CCMP2878 / gene_product=hypothetical protein / transcript_product=hypothetical protein / location=Cvel_scaffold549:9903-13069(+) / protein_length=475 / sequence_SO=supercontig / SO=protein_coding / is_pseudo=false
MAQARNLNLAGNKASAGSALTSPRGFGGGSTKVSPRGGPAAMVSPRGGASGGGEATDKGGKAAAAVVDIGRSMEKLVKMPAWQTLKASCFRNKWVCGSGVEMAHKLMSEFDWFMESLFSKGMDPYELEYFLADGLMEAAIRHDSECEAAKTKDRCLKVANSFMISAVRILCNKYMAKNPGGTPLSEPKDKVGRICSEFGKCSNKMADVTSAIMKVCRGRQLTWKEDNSNDLVNLTDWSLKLVKSPLYQATLEECFEAADTSGDNLVQFSELLTFGQRFHKQKVEKFFKNSSTAASVDDHLLQKHLGFVGKTVKDPLDPHDFLVFMKRFQAETLLLEGVTRRTAGDAASVRSAAREVQTLVEQLERAGLPSDPSNPGLPQRKSSEVFWGIFVSPDAGGGAGGGAGQADLTVEELQRRMEEMGSNGSNRKGRKSVGAGKNVRVQGGGHRGSLMTPGAGGDSGSSRSSSESGSSSDSD